MEKLKCAFYEEEANIWTKEDIIKRLIAIFATSIKSEIYTSGQYSDCEKTTKKALTELEERYKVFKNFTQEEKDYINCKDNNHLKFGWRYECCAILL